MLRQLQELQQAADQARTVNKQKVEALETERNALHSELEQVFVGVVLGRLLFVASFVDCPLASFHDAVIGEGKS